MTDSTDLTSDSHPTSATDRPVVASRETDRSAGVVVAFPTRRPDVSRHPAYAAVHAAAPVADGGAFTVDCADCAHRHSTVCDDCVVSFIVGREPEDALVVDAAEARAVRLLEQAGLVPGVRHEWRASGQ